MTEISAGARRRRSARELAGSRLFTTPLKYLGLFVLGLVAAAAGMSLIPATENHLGPVTVSTEAHLGKPGTTLQVPPVGSIEAKTHQVPLAVTLSVTEIDPAAIAKMLAGSPDQEALTAQLAEAIQTAGTDLARRSLLGGVLIGALVLALLPGRRWTWVLAGALGGLVGIATLLGRTWIEFRPDAFREPNFTGSLERAPQLIKAIQEQNVSLDLARSRVQGAAARLSSALTLLGQPVGDPGSDSVALLHISDIHSNPLGLEFARELASRFKVDAILDTGDLTSFGEPIEGRIGELVSQMTVPYLYVPGNHDSPPIRAAIAGIPNVVLLDGTAYDLQGVRIEGFADPSFTATGETSNAEHDAAVRADAGRVGARVEADRPGVLAVHAALQAADSAGEVPLVLAGHRHKQASREHKGTLFLEVGSTGATGLGSFLTDADTPYEAEILYFRDGTAFAYDYVTFNGLGSDFQIQRRSISQEI